MSRKASFGTQLSACGGEPVGFIGSGSSSSLPTSFQDLAILDVAATPSPPLLRTSLSQQEGEMESSIKPPPRKGGEGGSVGEGRNSLARGRRGMEKVGVATGQKKPPSSSVYLLFLKFS